MAGSSIGQSRVKTDAWPHRLYQSGMILCRTHFPTLAIWTRPDAKTGRSGRITEIRVCPFPLHQITQMVYDVWKSRATTKERRSTTFAPRTQQRIYIYRERRGWGVWGVVMGCKHIASFVMISQTDRRNLYGFPTLMARVMEPRNSCQSLGS